MYERQNKDVASFSIKLQTIIISLLLVLNTVSIITSLTFSTQNIVVLAQEDNVTSMMSPVRDYNSTTQLGVNSTIASSNFIDTEEATRQSQLVNDTTSARRNVIFIHPDGTTQSHYSAVRLLEVGPDGQINWDRHLNPGLLHIP
ncbi:MAG: hypothetical protein GEU26_13645 [Nitrososphaeraceae archaeon]|nr:hypothetical protein [Nitrososphaeraceae archaeon]